MTAYKTIVRTYERQNGTKIPYTTEIRVGFKNARNRTVCVNRDKADSLLLDALEKVGRKREYEPEVAALILKQCGYVLINEHIEFPDTVGSD